MKETKQLIKNKLNNVSGILIPGGFGKRGSEGKIMSAKWARETNTPYLGVCFGFQLATIEFARSVLGLKEAKDLVEGAPKEVKSGVNKKEAEEIKAKLEAAGAKVELK